MTGSGVIDAVMPGQMGGAARARDDHLEAPVGGRRGRTPTITSGVRCAETTRTS